MIADFAPLMSASSNGDRIALAETVDEAHLKLFEAEPANEPVFQAVIRFADEDVERLKNADRE